MNPGARMGLVQPLSRGKDADRWPALGTVPTLEGKGHVSRQTEGC